METAQTTVYADDLYVSERLIVAPANGVFCPLPAVVDGGTVEPRQPIGKVTRPTDEVAVVSPHRGRLMGMLALPGERVRELQPIAWVRTGG